MVSLGTYANLLALYRCTVSVAIKRFSSIFNLYRCSFRFSPPRCIPAPSLLSFPIFFFFSFILFPRNAAHIAQFLRGSYFAVWKESFACESNRASIYRAFVRRNVYTRHAHLSTLSCSPETIKIPFAQISHCCPLRRDGEPSGVPAKWYIQWLVRCSPPINETRNTYKREYIYSTQIIYLSVSRMR